MSGGRWRWLGFGGIAILAALEINEIVSPHTATWKVVATLAVTAVIAGAWIPLMVRFQRDRQSAFGPVLIAVIAIGSVGLDFLTPGGAAIIPAIVTLATMANRFDTRVGTGLAVIFIAAYLMAT